MTTTQPAKIFLADSHLVPFDEVGAKHFADTLSYIQSQYEPGELYLVGDIFDFWFEYKNFVMVGFRSALDALRQMSQAGWQIKLFHGNHDFCMGSTLEREVGAVVIPDRHYFEHAGKRMRVEHGDLLVANDFIYTLWCTVMRRKLTMALLRALPPFIIDWIIDTVTKLSRGVTKRGTINDRKVDQLLKDHSRVADCDVWVCGHLHVSQDVTVYTNAKHVRLRVLPAWSAAEPLWVELDAQGEFHEKRTEA